MLPKEITALFAKTPAMILPILGNPKDDDLTALCKVLTPLLLSIPYNEDGVTPLHNLIGLIKPPMAYLTTTAITNDTKRPNTTFALHTLPPTNLPNAPS
jgi:hypothetical protein